VLSKGANFGRDDPATREALQWLVASLPRHLEPGRKAAIAADGLVELAESRPPGGTHVLDALWERLGIGPATRGLLTGRRLDPSAERVLFALTANRALALSSKLGDLFAVQARREILDTVTGLDACVTCSPGDSDDCDPSRKPA